MSKTFIGNENFNVPVHTDETGKAIETPKPPARRLVELLDGIFWPEVENNRYHVGAGGWVLNTEEVNTIRVLLLQLRDEKP